MAKFFIVAAIGASFAGAAVAQSWTNRIFAGFSNGVYYPTQPPLITTDKAGNAYVAGTMTVPTLHHGYDEFVVKYSSSGIPLWTNQFNLFRESDGFCAVQAITTDASNNVYIAGWEVPLIASTPFSDYGVSYGVTIAIASNGMPLWTNLLDSFDLGNNLAPGDGGDGQDKFFAMASDSQRNVIYVTGSGRRPDQLYPTSDVTVVAYAADGSRLWLNTFNGGGAFTDANGDITNSLDVGLGIAVDLDNNVLVAARTISDRGDADCATIKYTRDGVPLWTNVFNSIGSVGNESDTPRGITTDKNGNVFVLLGNGEYNFQNMTIIAYSPSGLPLWTNRNEQYVPDSRLQGGGGSAPAIATDKNGNVFVAGARSSDRQVFLAAKYSNAGVLLWTNRDNVALNGIRAAKSITVDSAGRVIVGANDASRRYATVAYSNDGDLLWVRRHSFGAENAATVDKSSNVFVTGGFYDPPTGGSRWTTIKYAAFYPFFGAPTGTYIGLFLGSNVTHRTAGYFQFNLDTKWKVLSGQVNLGGTSYPFSGQFNSNTYTATITVPRKNDSPLVMFLWLSQLSSGEYQVEGAISDGVWTADVLGDNAYYKGGNPPQLGTYTFTLLPQSGQDFDGEGSPGYGTTGTVTVKSNGVVSVSLKLADQKAGTETTYLNKHGVWPLYTKQYGGLGSLLGWVTFTNTPDYKFIGDVSWIKTASNGVYYTKGFTNDVIVIGSKLH